MRLFVAVPVTHEVASAAENAVQTLHSCLPHDVSARWVPPENMHLTVRFIGHVEDTRVQELVDAVRAPLPMAPFHAGLGECGVFPQRGAPRVIWIGVREGLPSLRAMHEEFDRRLERVGFESEPREFNVHLTLARIKDPGRGGHRTLRACMDAVKAPATQWQIAGATVFQSVLSGKGSTYHPLAHVPCIG